MTTWARLHRLVGVAERQFAVICSDLPKRVLQIVYIYVFTFCLHEKGMAERKSQETDVQLVFRRQTRDLKDVQDVLKSVMESSGQ